ncbi:unnamed protein product [Tilletia controversa]|uniref:Peptidase M43 pregnancy-associated plasma-A domain-containing protein n=3 Tax=Tilletia TaxID=13289 RepID=A0A8X7SUV8_9BASI|nr:hypothetical protein CF336_g3264 [Tilletia laevis]KAE8198850.1 hypothetical protein CF328_g3429 [Tilletia controversa]KAE8253092.1 hypothetical protein A4X03_0g5991 [Tilletia caries]KAE8202074.1 hypothetical protein CF335_g3554 [Tilletia laevis]KAE8242536.1 hypothetical protein A4X06_0g6864 [Tilletia controversa]
MRLSLTTAALALFALGASSTVSAKARPGHLCATNKPANRTLEAQFAPLIAAQRQREKQGTQREAPRVIQVYVHVISSGSTGKIPLARIQQQIAVLNSDYYQANYRFNLGSTTYTDMPAWYGTIRDETTSSGLSMKKALYRGGKASLNLYITSLANGLLGYSTFPWDYNTYNPSWEDGVVVHGPSLPSTSTAFAPYNLGRTATHEVGHWLGLYHPFQGESCSSSSLGDYVTDTPLQSTPSFGCPTSKNTCSAAGADSIHNFMDYSDDACMQMFTAGQQTRLRALSLKYRGI